MASRSSLPTAILAAGEGSRLRAGSPSQPPKPGILLQNRPIAEWSLRAFRSAGVSNFRIGLGYQADEVGRIYTEIAQKLEVEIELLTVADWEKGNGVTALALAQSYAGEPFLLSMADHLFSPRMIRQIHQHPLASERLALAVDRHRESFVDLDDLTKVQIESGRIVSIGKDLATWNAGDTGLFRMSDALVQGLYEAQEDEEYSLSDGVRRCINRGLVDAVVLGEASMWLDIDTAQDLEVATLQRSELLAEISPRRVAG